MSLSKNMIIIIGAVLLILLLFAVFDPALAQEEPDMDDDEAEVTENDHDHDHEHDHGIIGGFFHFLGDVVAFPFRMIGAAFDAIF